jgi:hypothetical protein
VAATDDELLALAQAYFDETWDPPPEDLAAMHGDIGALVRHVAEGAADDARRAALATAVDAIDDGLAVDLVLDRLGAVLGDTGDPVGRLADRVLRVAEGSEG